MEREETGPDVDRAIEEMESRRGEMEGRSDELSEGVEAARHEWQSRRSDGQVPGAIPPDDESDEDEDEGAEDDEEEGPQDENEAESGDGDA